MEQQPLVLIGARSEARGRLLEHRLTEDGRVAVLGVHTSCGPLMRAAQTSPSATVLLDTVLDDATSLEAATSLALRRPCPIVALVPPLAGELTYQLLRAGVLDCLIWDNTQKTVDALARRLVDAAHTTIEDPVLVAAGSSSTRPADAMRAATSRTVLLVGSRRATLLCDALARLPGHFPGALLCCEPVHTSALDALVVELARRTALRVRHGGSHTLSAGGVYLFDASDTLHVEESATSATLQLTASESTARIDAMSWLDAMAASLSHRLLEVVIVSSGHLDAATISILSRMLGIGVALARTVPGGYQVRWPGADAADKFDATGFWHQLHSHMCESAGIDATGPTLAEEAAGGLR